MSFVFGGELMFGHDDNSRLLEAAVVRYVPYRNTSESWRLNGFI
jgi:hypothetical protein